MARDSTSGVISASPCARAMIANSAAPPRPNSIMIWPTGSRSDTALTNASSSAKAAMATIIHAAPMAFSRAGVSVFNEEDRRAKDLVVVGAHRVAVGTGHGCGQQVTHRQVLGDPGLSHQYVAGFAVLAYHPD